jgi:hypothetical protein
MNGNRVEKTRSPITRTYKDFQLMNTVLSPHSYTPIPCYAEYFEKLIVIPPDEDILVFTKAAASSRVIPRTYESNRIIEPCLYKKVKSRQMSWGNHVLIQVLVPSPLFQ